MLLRHLSLLGAVFSLLWQGVAYASPRCAEMQQKQSVAMAGMADCVNADKQSKPDSVPCKDMAASCMAMVGCASLAALEAMPVAVALQTDLAEVAASRDRLLPSRDGCRQQDHRDVGATLNIEIVPVGVSRLQAAVCGAPQMRPSSCSRNPSALGCVLVRPSADWTILKA